MPLKRAEQLVRVTKQRREGQMPKGIGTYGSKKGRPPKKPVKKK